MPAPRTGGVELVGLWTHFATADEEDDAFLREQLERFTALARRRCASVIRRPDPACRQQRGDAARRRSSTSTWSAAASRSTGSTPSASTRPPAGLSPAMSLHSYVADVKRFGPGEPAATAAAGRRRARRRSAVLPIGYGDGVQARARQPRRRAGRRVALADRRDGLDGQPDDRARGRIRRRGGRAGGADRRPGRGADPRRGAGAAGWRRSTTRSPAGSRPRVPRAYQR